MCKGFNKMKKQHLDEYIIKTIEGKFDINEFQIDNNDINTDVVLKNSELFFHLEMDETHYKQFKYIYTINKGLKKLPVNKTDHFYNWVDVFPSFKQWLDISVTSFIAERDYPDPLERIRNASKLWISLNLEATPFTPEEKVIAKQAIEELQSGIESNFNLDEATKDNVTIQLQYLTDAVDRLNKRDWMALGKTLLYDLGVSITSNLMLTAGTATGTAIIAATSYTLNPAFVQLVTDAFKYFFRH